jgi:drug/metabolite transporter (DMT)-like permease
MNHQHPHFSKSTFEVALAALCWGVSGGIGGILMADGWDPYLTSFYRGTVGLVFIIAWLIVSPKSKGFYQPRLWGWSILAGLGVAGNFTFYLISINEGSVAIAATLMYCAPVFVYIASFVMKLEKVTPLKLVAIGVVIAGIVLLTRVYDVGAASVTILGIAAGLMAGVSYALFIFGFKFAASHGSSQEILIIAFTVLAVVLIWPAEMGQTADIVQSLNAWPFFIALGVLGAGVSFVFYVKGLYYTAPTVASILAMIEPVTASLFGLFLLNESLDGLQFLGMGLILLTVTALSVKSDA